MYLPKPILLEGHEIYHDHKGLEESLERCKIIKAKRTDPKELELYRQLIERFRLHIALLEKHNLTKTQHHEPTT